MTADMARIEQLHLKAKVTKRWFFWPAMLSIVALSHLRIIRSPERAARWLADHAMRLEVVSE